MSNYIVDTEYGDERANVGHDGAKGAAVAEGLSGELPGSESKGRLWGSECKRVLALAVPISLSEVVSFFAYLITTAQVGHLGSLELSVITLARSFFHITGLSLVIGMASAVETFCGQAYGARHYRTLGVVLQRAVLLCLVTCCLPIALWVNAAPAMLLLGQQPEVVGPAAAYVRLLSPALCMWAVTTCIRSYFQSQAVAAPLTVVSAACTALTPLVNHLFIFVLDMGMVGAAIAYNVIQALELLFLLAAMVWLHRCRQGPGTHTWRGFSRRALKGWRTYLRVALPSGAAICLDWWMYEAVVLVAGALPDAKEQLGAMGLAFSTHALLFMVVEGFGAAASTRVANELGAGHGPGARFACRVCLALGLAAPLVASGGLLAAPRAWAALYTPDTTVIDLVAALMPVLCVSNVADSVAAVLSGVLRGAGRQELAFKVNLGAYWLLGLPLAVLLGLQLRLGAMGLWLAMGGASALQAAIFYISVMRFDWGEEARKALHRVENSEGAAAAAAAAGEGAVGAGEREPLLGPSGEEAVDEEQEEKDAQEAVARVRGGHVPLHGGADTRHGVHEPTLTSEHVV